MMRWKVFALALPLAAFLTAGGAALAAESPREVVATKLAKVGLEETVNPNGDVTGIVINKSDETMRDVKLLIRHTWHWKNEYRPGENNPGRAEYVTIDREIAPGERASFHYEPQPPLPERRDGHFETSASVVGYTAVGLTKIEYIH